MIKNKKSQIDVALTVGAIIIPVTALIGSLLFAWTMISPTGDACRLAAAIAYDVSSLLDSAYAAPDNIAITYKVPSVCKFVNLSNPSSPVKGDITCFNGYMNISGGSIGYTLSKQPTLLSSQLSTDDCTNFVNSVETSVSFVLPASKMAQFQDNIPPVVSYPAYASLTDSNFNAVMHPTVDNGITVSKKSAGLYGTVTTINEAVDPFFGIVEAAFEACKSGRNSSTVFCTPRYYSIISAMPPSSTEPWIALLRHAFPPNTKLGVNSGPTYNPVIVRGFYFSEFISSGFTNCTFAMDSTTFGDVSTYEGWANDGGVCFRLSTTVSCTPNGVTNAGCACADSCTLSSTAAPAIAGNPHLKVTISKEMIARAA